MDRQRVFEQLKQDEGVIYKIYRDHLGYPTFGVGHLVKESDPEWGAEIGTAISEQRVWEVFERDLENAIADAYSVFGKRTFNFFPGEVQEIVVNMIFNMGRKRFMGFKRMIAALQKFDYQEAAKEGRDSKWYTQVTNRAERLMTRLEQVA